MTNANTSARSYERIAWFYEKLAHVYSLGRIKAAKLSQVETMSPGDRVLYVGVGSGEDALAAARKGAQVTCLDLSSSMLRRVRKRFDLEGLKGEFVCADVMDFTPPICTTLSAPISFSTSFRGKSCRTCFDR